MSESTRAFIKENNIDKIKSVVSKYLINMQITKHETVSSTGYYSITGDFIGEGKLIHLHELMFGGVFVEEEEEEWYFEKYKAREESNSYSLHKSGVPDETLGVLISSGSNDHSVLLFFILIQTFGSWIEYRDYSAEGFVPITEKQINTHMKWGVRRCFNARR